MELQLGELQLGGGERNNGIPPRTGTSAGLTQSNCNSITFMCPGLTVPEQLFLI